MELAGLSPLSSRLLVTTDLSKWTNEQPAFVWEQAGGEATAKPYSNTNPGLSLIPWLPCVGLLSGSLTVPAGGNLWELFHPCWVSLPSAQPG